MSFVKPFILFSYYKQWVNNLPLRIKLILPTWLVMTLVLISGGAAITHVVNENLKQRLLYRAEIIANSAASSLTSALAYKNKTDIMEQLSDYSHDPDIVAAVITQANGEQFKKIKQLPKKCQDTDDPSSCRSSCLINISKPIELGDNLLGNIKLYISLEAVEKENQRLIGFLIISSLFLSLLAWIFTLLIHRFVTEPISSLHQSISNIISLSTFSQPIPVKHHDELGQLTECFNKMVSTLAERDKQLKTTLCQLEKKNRYIYQVIDAMDHGVIVIAPEDKVTYYNPAAENMLAFLGCGPNNLNQMMEILEPVSAMAQLSQAIDEHIPISMVEVHHKQSGRIYRVRSVPIATEQHSLVQFEDITLFHLTEHRRMLAELIFDQNQNALLVLSRNLEVEAQNVLCVNTFGPLKHLTDITFNKAFRLTFTEIKNLLVQGNYQWHTTLLSTRDVQIPCRLTAQTVANRKGKVGAFILSIVDQTVALEFQRLNHIAHHDPLTGLANRAHAYDKLAKYHEKGCNMHVLFVDLDGFKAVNDQFGHHIGDELLKVIARRLVANVSRNDMVARLAGDEFLLALKNSYHAVDIVQRLLAKLSEVIHINGLMPQISASIGIRHWPASDNTPLNVVIEQADKAMYKAKACGKNCYSIMEVHELEWVL